METTQGKPLYTVSQLLFTECLTCAMHRIRNSPVLLLPTIPEEAFFYVLKEETEAQR